MCTRVLLQPALASQNLDWKVHRKQWKDLVSPCIVHCAMAAVPLRGQPCGEPRTSLSRLRLQQPTIGYRPKSARSAGRPRDPGPEMPPSAAILAPLWHKTGNNFNRYSCRQSKRPARDHQQKTAGFVNQIAHLPFVFCRSFRTAALAARQPGHSDYRRTCCRFAIEALLPHSDL